MNDSSVEQLYIRCLHSGYDIRYPETKVRLYHISHEDPVILIWLPGGPGRRSDCVELDGLLGKRRILIPSNPYTIHSYIQTSPTTWDYVPEAFGKDQPLRILSIVQWAKYKGYRVILGGHSNGVPRTIGYLAQSSNNQRLVDGIILSAGHIGGIYGPRLPLHTIEWNVPVLVVHHSRDHCSKCSPTYQHWAHSELQKRNKKHTHLACLTSGDPKPSTDCSGQGLHHMYMESRMELADSIDQFIHSITDNS